MLKNVWKMFHVGAKCTGWCSSTKIMPATNRVTQPHPQLSFHVNSKLENKFDAASKYDSNSTEQREDGLYLLEKLGPIVGNTVLDLGCGTGYLTKVLADRVGPEGKVSCVHEIICTALVIL